MDVTGGQNGAAIGTGIESGDCDITIHNSSVKVNSMEITGSGTGAPGIGSGKDTDEGVEVNIRLTGGGTYLILANDSRAFSVPPVFENYLHATTSYYNWGVDPYFRDLEFSRG